MSDSSSSSKYNPLNNKNFLDILVKYKLRLVSCTSIKEKNEVKLDFLTKTKSNLYCIEGTLKGSPCEVKQCKVGLGNGLGRFSSSDLNERSLYRFTFHDNKYDYNYCVALLLKKDMFSKLTKLPVNTVYRISNLKISFECEKSSSIEANNNNFTNKSSSQSKEIKKQCFHFTLYNSKNTIINIETNNTINLKENTNDEILNLSNYNDLNKICLETEEAENNNNNDFNNYGNYQITSPSKLNDINLDEVNHKTNQEQIYSALRKLDPKLKDFTPILRKQTDRMFFSLNSISSFISTSSDTYDLVGVVISVKNEDKLSIIEITSLKDSNIIKVYIYNKKVSNDLTIGTVVVLKKLQIKVNKNLDLIIENPLDYNIEIIGKFEDSEIHKYKKFRYDSTSFDTILGLCKNTINRSLQKVSYCIITYTYNTYFIYFL